MKARLDDLVIDPSVFPRFAIDQGRVAEMIQLYVDGGPEALPRPEIVIGVDGAQILTDGVTRVSAARAVGLEELEVDVLDVPAGADPIDIGHLRAVELAATAAKPLTAAERRRAILQLLDRHHDWPDREIARRAGVSHQTVGRLRITRERNSEPATDAADAYVAVVSAVRISDQLARGLARAWAARGVTDLVLSRMPATLASSLSDAFGDDALLWATRLERWAADARKRLAPDN
jgi:hypothetical protein